MALYHHQTDGVGIFSMRICTLLPFWCPASNNFRLSSILFRFRMEGTILVCGRYRTCCLARWFHLDSYWCCFRYAPELFRENEHIRTTAFASLEPSHANRIMCMYTYLNVWFCWLTGRVRREEKRTRETDVRVRFTLEELGQSWTRGAIHHQRSPGREVLVKPRTGQP